MPDDTKDESIHNQAIVQIATDLHRIAIDLSMLIEFLKPPEYRKEIEEIFATRAELLKQVVDRLSVLGLGEWEKFMECRLPELKGPGDYHKDSPRNHGRFVKKGEE